MTDEVKQKRRAIGKRTEQLANAEIDRRLAQAICDRADAIKMVSKLVHWQDRLARLEQEINSLIGFQQRLSGHVDHARVGVLPEVLSPTSFPGHLAGNLDGITSIPTKGANPKPSGANVADIAGEGGFS